MTQSRAILQDLLPPGRAWRMPGRLGLLLDALSDEMSRTESLAAYVAAQLFPQGTTDYLSAWEAALGLPDACAPNVLPDDLRRQAIVSRLRGLSGMSRAEIEEWMAAFGVDADVVEFRPFLIGHSAVGDALADARWRYAWAITGDLSVSKYAVVGEAVVGDPIAAPESRAEFILCALRHIMPAHTILAVLEP